MKCRMNVECGCNKLVETNWQPETKCNGNSSIFISFQVFGLVPCLYVTALKVLFPLHMQCAKPTLVTSSNLMGKHHHHIYRVQFN